MGEGLSREEALNHFYMVDRQGLLFDDMDDLTPQQRPFARKRSDFKNADQLTDLEEIVRTIRPTILVGTSTQPGAFTENIVRLMCETCERPIIFPLSNPTELAEATAQNLIVWSEGKALVATGIPAGSVTYEGVEHVIGQANNALIYPGLGLGMLASEASLLTDEMISAAAHSLGGMVDATQPGAPVLPPFRDVRRVSTRIAEAVARKAQERGLSRTDQTDMAAAVHDIQWEPRYYRHDLVFRPGIDEKAGLRVLITRSANPPSMTWSSPGLSDYLVEEPLVMADHQQRSRIVGKTSCQSHLGVICSCACVYPPSYVLMTVMLRPLMCCRSNMTHRAHVASTSATSWEITMPMPWYWRMASTMAFRISLSTWLVGSSSTSTSGRAVIAQATCNRFVSPPESVS